MPNKYMETKTEETKETTTETEETEVEIVDENGEKIEPEKYSENEKKLYARLQKEKEKKSKLVEELKSLKESKETKMEPKENKETKENNSTPIDEIGLARKIKVLQEYDEDEIEFAQVLAKGSGKDILEVIKMEQFKTFSEAKREKDKKANLSQQPNGKQGTFDKKDPMFEKFSQNLPRGFDFNKK